MKKPGLCLTFSRWFLTNHPSPNNWIDIILALDIYNCQVKMCWRYTTIMFKNRLFDNRQSCWYYVFVSLRWNRTKPSSVNNRGTFHLEINCFSFFMLINLANQRISSVLCRSGHKQYKYIPYLILFCSLDIAFLYKCH